MDIIRRFVQTIKYRISGDEVAGEEKRMYLVTLFMFPSWAIVGIVLNVIGLNKSYEYLGFAAFMLVFSIAYIILRFGELRFYKYFVVIIVNFLILPTFFFITGDIYNGVVLFFPLGIIVTFIVIKDKIVYIFAMAELLWDCIMISMPMYNYEKFKANRVDTTDKSGLGIIICFIGAIIAPIVIILYQSYLHEKTSKNLEDSTNLMNDAKLNKSRFLSNMTNEIRMPMNSIVSMNELLLREELDAESKELAESIRTSSAQLLKIINNILEFAKLDSNRMNLYPQKYDFKKMLQEIINAVSVEYASDDNEFYVSIDPSIPRYLFGDNVRMKQVFLYLLFATVNKFPHNRILLTVNSDIDETTNTCVLNCTIAESGLGMSDGEIEAMMSAYTKYDSRQKSDYKAMGLEISICKEILGMMGGNLTIESVEGVGILVRFDMINYIIDERPIVKISPVKEYSVLVYCNNAYENDIWIQTLSPFQVYPSIVTGPNAFRNAIENRRYTHIFIDAEAFSILQDTINQTGISSCVYIVTRADSVYTDFGECKIIRKPLNCINVVSALNNEWEASNYKVAAKKELVTYPEAKVLIVDDSIVNLKVLEGMLSTFRIAAKKAQSGAKALEILEKEEFDLLILDQRMPEMDGIELFEHIKNLKNANALIPILCATADFGPEVSRYLIEVGFSDYLAKPVRRFYLERMLRTFLPVELAVNIKIDEVEDKKKSKSEVKKEVSKEEVKEDPLVIDFESGKEIAGGDNSAYCEILLSYYKEGCNMLSSVPMLYKTDMSLYTIEVHALKSSSAAIGAKGVSALFKELEFASRANNEEFVESHSKYAFEQFEVILGKVKIYLEENNVSVDAHDNEPSGDEVTIETAQIDEVLEFLAKFNLKMCEEKLREMVTVNYGTDINVKLKEIMDSYDHFDYHKVRDDLNSLKEYILQREG